MLSSGWATSLNPLHFCLFLNFQFEVELYYIGPAGLQLTTAQAGLALAIFLPQPLEQQCRPVSPGLVLQRCFHSAPHPQLSSTITSAQTPPSSVGLPQTGSCRPSANQVCHFLPTLFPFSSPFSSPHFCPQRQAGRQRQYLLLTFTPQ